MAFQGITREDIFHLNYYTYGQPFTGSYQGMRYRIQKIETQKDELEKGEKQKEKQGGQDAIDQLQAVVWPEPMSFDATPEEKKQSCLFDFSEEGQEQLVDWLNKIWKNFSRL